MAQQPQKIDLLDLNEEDFKKFVAGVSNEFQAFKQLVQDIDIHEKQARDLITGAEKRSFEVFITKAEFKAFQDAVNTKLGKMAIQIIEITKSIKTLESESDYEIVDDDKTP